VIIDSSAVIAILKRQPDAERYLTAIENAGELKMSIANYVESAILVDSDRNPANSRRLDDLLKMAEVQLVPVSVEQGRAARAAYRDFGRGSGHPAKFNFGDCFAYALAKETGEPLLFKGNDFRHTDVEAAV
jgi:ribonuclease VapC